VLQVRSMSLARLLVAGIRLLAYKYLRAADVQSRVSAVAAIPVDNAMQVLSSTFGQRKPRLRLRRISQKH
jgi:hypothetical protein